MAVDDGGERAGQPCMWIDCVHLAGLDQRGDDGPVFCVCIMAGKERVLPVQGDGADRALDGVAVELDAAICQETAQAVAVFRDRCQCLTEGRFGGSAGAVMAQPIIKAGKDRDGTFFEIGRAHV